MMNVLITGMTLGELFVRYPYARDFFEAFGEYEAQETLPVADFFSMLDDELLAGRGGGREDLPRQLAEYLAFMQQLTEPPVEEVRSITIVGGRDKRGVPENCCLTIRPGEIICIVGPTGSGKSRLLADIEWLAQGDTPTGRCILINGQPPPGAIRFSVEQKLVAQLSQNMNFIMDLTVEEFIAMHAGSRMREDVAGITRIIVEEANRLAGEAFAAATPVTALSGGQSRALMIADTAFLSRSPIVLIDEIENAGIDRRQALGLLITQQKIVLMATHDPFLALLGDKRIVTGNGGIRDVLDTSAKERENLRLLQSVDAMLNGLRQDLRSGRRVELDQLGLIEGLKHEFG